MAERPATTMQIRSTIHLGPWLWLQCHFHVVTARAPRSAARILTHKIRRGPRARRSGPSAHLHTMRVARFERGFRRTLFGTQPRSVPIPGTRIRSQSLLQSNGGCQRPSARVLHVTIAAFEDAGRAEDHGSREMPCEACAR